MEPDAFTLARLISMAALIGATIEYAEIVRRRSEARAHARERAELDGAGLQGLVRVLLADAASSER